jgi:endonuclease YncB( thermonuclease family)|tara:strand:- start:5622 stop:5825 length:204 start_codon:yes stop_codon:yes gene_type:complete
MKQPISFAVALIASLLLVSLPAGASKPLFHYIKPVSAQCTRAVDGYTIIVNIAGQKERVRLIGVDTP